MKLQNHLNLFREIEKIKKLQYIYFNGSFNVNESLWK